MKKIRLKILLMLVLLCFSNSTFIYAGKSNNSKSEKVAQQSKSTTTTDKGKILLIGDSRTYGAYLYCKDYRKKFLFLAEGGVSCQFIKNSNLNVKLGDVMPDAITNTLTKAKKGKTVKLEKAIKSKNVTAVVYLLGANGAESWLDSKTCDYTKDTLEKLGSLGVKVYYATVLPTTDKYKGYSNDCIKKNNDWAKENLKDVSTIIDTYATVTNIKNWESHTSDGLHYDKKVYSAVLKSIEGAVALGGQGKVQTINEKNADAFVLANDGKERPADKLIGDSGVDSSFKDVEYYDCFVPYNMTCESIGGYLKSKSPGNKKVGAEVMVQGFDTCNPTRVGNFKASGKVDEEDKMTTLTDEETGVTYYLMAVQTWFYGGIEGDAKKVVQAGNKGIDSKHPGVNGMPVGKIIDVILTDGTCIHFLYYDENAVVHTNRNADGNVALHKKQYECLFSYSNFNCIELNSPSKYTKVKDYGASTAFKSKYFKNGAKIAYYRIYNKTILDHPEPINQDAKQVAHNTSGGTVVAENGTVISSNETNAKNNASPVNGYFSEEALSANIALAESNLENSLLSKATRDKLEAGNLDTINDWEFNIEQGKEDSGLIAIVRMVVMFLGIAIAVWSVLIYLAFWFDTINNFVEFSLLGILTLGRLQVSPEEDQCTFWDKGNADDKKMKTVNHRAIIVVSLVAMGFSVIILTGVIYKVLDWFVNLIFDFYRNF